MAKIQKRGRHWDIKTHPTNTREKHADYDNMLLKRLKTTLTRCKLQFSITGEPNLPADYAKIIRDNVCSKDSTQQTDDGRKLAANERFNALANAVKAAGTTTEFEDDIGKDLLSEVKKLILVFQADYPPENIKGKKKTCLIQ